MRSHEWQITYPYEIYEEKTAVNPYVHDKPYWKVKLKKIVNCQGKPWGVYLNQGRKWKYLGIIENPNDWHSIYLLIKMHSPNAMVRYMPKKSFRLSKDILVAHKPNTFNWYYGQPWAIKRRYGGWWLCLVKNWKVFGLCYLRKHQVMELWTRKLEKWYHQLDLLTIENYAKGWELGYPPKAKTSREDEGIGQEIIEAAEDGTAWDKIVEYLEDGDYEAAKELAQEYGYEEEFKQLTGEEDDEN